MLQYLFTNPILFLINIVSLIVAITVHEWAHAFMADKLGDPTPSLQGRVTLDPRKHLDMYGSLFLLLFGFGWGRPVQFDPFNLRNPRKDGALISIAGPASNMIMAILFAILIRLFFLFPESNGSTIGFIFFQQLIAMNLMLAIFNLIPIHPLDGFKVVGGLLDKEQAREWYKLERYGVIFLLLLIMPFNGVSMLHRFLDPILAFLFRLFIPFGL